MTSFYTNSTRNKGRSSGICTKSGHSSLDEDARPEFVEEAKNVGELDRRDYGVPVDGREEFVLNHGKPEERRRKMDPFFVL